VYMVAHAAGLLTEVGRCKRNGEFINEELRNVVLTPKSRICSNLKYTYTVNITEIPIHSQVLWLCTESVK
jgi:hypothetical protein